MPYQPGDLVTVRVSEQPGIVVGAREDGRYDVQLSHSMRDGRTEYAIHTFAENQIATPNDHFAAQMDAQVSRARVMRDAEKRINEIAKEPTKLSVN